MLVNVRQVVAYYLEELNISSPFGEERGSGTHKGTDFTLPGREDYGNPVYTPVNGYVKRTGYQEQGAGYYVVIGDGNHETKYFHLIDTNEVSDENTVEVGDIIGRIGNSGNSTGPHLHMERWENGQVIDPVPWLEGLRKEEFEMTSEDAEKILRYLKASWYIVEGNDQAEQEFHRLANEVRKSAGMEVE